MARIRTVKPEFWKSESIAALPFRTRLTFIGLWTYVDDNGVGVDSFKLISAELFGLEEDPREARANVREDLARLHAAGRIIRYVVAGKRYLAIVNWAEHQKIDKPGRSRHPASDDVSASLLNREDAWNADGGTALPSQDSRDSRETLAPGTGNRGSGNRDQGTGDSAKAATAAAPAAQEAFADMPEPKRPEETSTQIAFRLARAWIKIRADQKTPVVARGKADPALPLKNVIEPAIKASYEEHEINEALIRCDKGIPSVQQFETALSDIRKRRPAANDYQGRRPDYIRMVDSNHPSRDYSEPF